MQVKGKSMFGKTFSPLFDRMEKYHNGANTMSDRMLKDGNKGKSGSIHFIGIGGIGMSGMAEVLLNLGYSVTGSDMKKSPITERLENLGATIHYEHRKENIQNCEVVVFSAAVPMTNPEIREAKSKKIPIIPRAEMLNELVRMKKSIGIAGTHGKTTTTGMLSFVLKEAGLDPTMLVGGVLDSMGSNAHLGHGDFLVFEACEAYNSIDYFLPEISIVLNIDRDHLECYPNFDALKQTFKNFLNKVPFYSFCVANIDDENVRQLTQDLSKRLITFGFSEDADIRAVDMEFIGMSTRYLVTAFGKELGYFTLAIPGKHNVLNSLAVIAVALQIGVEPEKIQSAFHKFKNSERRFQVLYDSGKVMVVDDYAHHPNEITATLSAARNLIDGKQKKRVIAAFQPHLYSRTQMHYEGFSESLLLADKIYLSSIYPAREKPIPGVTSSLIYDLIAEKAADKIVYIDEIDSLVEKLKNEIEEGDVVIMMGAGNITRACHQLADSLK